MRARVGGWPGLSAFDGGAAPVALDVELEDRGVGHETVDGGERLADVIRHMLPPPLSAHSGDPVPADEAELPLPLQRKPI